MWETIITRRGGDGLLERSIGSGSESHWQFIIFYFLPRPTRGGSCRVADRELKYQFGPSVYGRSSGPQRREMRRHLEMEMDIPREARDCRHDLDDNGDRYGIKPVCLTTI